LKITKEELSRSETESALDLFLQGIRAEATKKKYTRTLRRILCDYFEELFEGDFEQRANELVKTAKENPEWVKDLLLKLSKKVKQRTELRKDHDDYLNPSSFDSYFKPIKKLFDMNDVSISWKRIYSTYPEIDNSFAGRGWTRQEIQRMLSFAIGAATITSNVEVKDGDLFIGSGAVIDGNVKVEGGTCTIDDGATVNGNREGACAS